MSYEDNRAPTCAVSVSDASSRRMCVRREKLLATRQRLGNDDVTTTSHRLSTVRTLQRVDWKCRK